MKLTRRKILALALLLAIVASCILFLPGLRNVGRTFQAFQFFHAPINFYGVVVDENHQPISGASTFYSVASLSFKGSPTLQGPATDNAGLFSITGKYGPSLSVRVEHPGYYPTDSADQKIEYAKREYMPGKAPPPPPSKDHPRVFVLKKKGVSEPLLHHEDVRTQLPFDGIPVTVNLKTGRVSPGDEAITISLRSTGDKLPLNTFHPFDWSATIQVSGGGLRERSDPLDFQAPADGYLPQFEVEMPVSRDAWQSSVEKDFFVSFDSGHYARIHLNLSGYKGRCIAEIFFNPTPGSRNLEPTSNKGSAP